MVSYKLFKSNSTAEVSMVHKLVDGVNVMQIPLVFGNADYQEYLAWLAEGNEPLPADDPAT